MGLFYGWMDLKRVDVDVFGIKFNFFINLLIKN